MKIIFSPEFTGTPYVNYSDGGVLFDTIFVNNSGLLSILELRAGLTCASASAAEREAQYLIAVEKHLKGAFYESSFEKDDWGVARTLLHWRDTLMMAGWNKDIKGISEKLDKLADIESDFLSIGEADRWVKIAKCSEIERLITNGDSIEIMCHKDLIEPLIQQILDKFGNKAYYTPISQPCGAENSNLRAIQEFLLNNKELNIEKKDDSFEIIKFDKKEDAYDWFVRQYDCDDNCVIVNSDANTYNSIAERYAKPKVNSVINNSNPQLLQLFKLGLSLFERPFNAYNILSYLQLPISPIPSSLRWQLANILIKEGGLGEKWYNIIDTFDFTNDKGKDCREEKLIFLQPIDAEYKPNAIAIKDIEQYNTALLNWSNKRMRADSTSKNEREIFNALKSFCSALNIIMNAHNAECIEYDKLNKWIQNIYRPISMKHNDAEEGSVNMIDDACLVYNSPEQLIWLDCNATNKIAYKYDFLTKTEIDKLKEVGILLASDAQILSAKHLGRNNAIAKVSKKITLITELTDLNEYSRENSLIVEINTPILTQKGDLCREEEEIDIVSLTTQNYYKIEKPIEINREKESYSSINTLIQYPFDYVLKYATEIYDNANNEFSDIDITRGTVAHYVIETIFKKAEYDTAKAREIIRVEYDGLFDSAVHCKGIILLSKENGLEYTFTKEKLKESILSLLTIIEENNLTPYECEAEIECELEDIGKFEAKIDMLLKNNDGYFVIFDFKWSENSNSYKKLLQESKEIQLALYERAVVTHYEKAVVAKCYYLLPKCKLYTCDNLNGSNIEKVSKKENIDIIRLIINSYAYRKSELKEGTIEEGECKRLDDLNYHKEENLFPLKSDNNNKDIKSLPYTKKRKTKNRYNQSNEDKATTYPILKSKLK